MNFTTISFIRAASAALIALPLVSCETTVVHPTEYKTVHRYVSADSVDKSVNQTRSEGNSQITFKSAARAGGNLTLLKP